jgi:hypothetical protein
VRGEEGKRWKGMCSNDGTSGRKKHHMNGVTDSKNGVAYPRNGVMSYRNGVTNYYAAPMAVRKFQ